MKFIFLILLFFSLEFKLLAQHQGIVENDTLYNKAKLYKKKGVYDLALKNYFKALEGYQFKNEIKKIIDTYNGIGLIYIELEKTLEAKKYFYSALNNAKKIDDKKRIAYSLNNLGISFHDELNLDSAIYYYNKSLNYKIAIDDSVGMSATLTNMGNIELDKEKYPMALNYYFRSLDYKLKLKDSLGISLIYGNIANAYGYLGKFDSTHIYLKVGLEIAEKKNFTPLLGGYYLNLAELYKEYGDYKRVNYYNELYINIQSILFNESMSKEIAKQQVKYEVSLKDKELDINRKKIVILEKEKEISRRNKQILFALIIGLVIGAILLYLLIKQRTKTIAEQNQVIEKQEQLNKLKLKNEQAEKKQLQIKKDQLERQMLFVSIQNLKKNELLQELYHNISKKRKQDIVEGDVIKDTINSLKNSLDVENDWEDFKVYFEQVHPNFFKILTSEHPVLTQIDHRHMAYMLIGLNTKEIARLMNISPDSVQKSRVRLKKKLNLTREQNLLDFIHNISMS